ncbi:hypothetical protein ACVBEF_04335 [Glaciimonas sp. GG7]
MHPQEAAATFHIRAETLQLPATGQYALQVAQADTLSPQIKALKLPFDKTLAVVDTDGKHCSIVAVCPYPDKLSSASSFWLIVCGPRVWLPLLALSLTLRLFWFPAILACAIMVGCLDCILAELLPGRLTRRYCLAQCSR